MKNNQFQKTVDHICLQIRKQTSIRPDIAIVLGSGWGQIVSLVKNPVVIPYAKIKGLPKCTVSGHSGNYIFGEIGNKKVVFMQGRFHLYEGNPASVIGVAVQVLNTLGAKKIILTNASGAINPSFCVGDIMVIEDHINLTGQNPLCGILPTPQKPIFVDMSKAYCKRGIEVARAAAVAANVKLHQGVHCQLLGPNYETPAEVNMLSKLGVDSVNMSTVVETIFARYLSMETIGLSLITNEAAGTNGKELSHEEVKAIASQNEEKLKHFLNEIITNF